MANDNNKVSGRKASNAIHSQTTDKSIAAAMQAGTTQNALGTGTLQGAGGTSPNAGNNSGSSGKPDQVHHFATNKSKKYTIQFERITKKYGLDLDDDWNKALMPHQGRHPYAYHDYVLDNMQKFDRIANGDKRKFLKLFEQMKQKIIDNPEMLYKDYWKK